MQKNKQYLLSLIFPKNIKQNIDTYEKNKKRYAFIHLKFKKFLKLHYFNRKKLYNNTFKNNTLIKNYN